MNVMYKRMKNKIIGVQASVVAGFIIGSSPAYATGTGGNNFSDIARNITTSMAELPGLITGIGYLLGILLGVMGILKIKDHVENPTQTPLKDGAIRLASGGALFALPIVLESMSNTIGMSSYVIAPAELNRVELRVQ